MIYPDITIARAINILNEAIELDPGMMQELVDTRVPCNELIAKHE